MGNLHKRMKRREEMENGDLVIGSMEHHLSEGIDYIR